MSLTGVKSQVDQIYILLKKMLKNQTETPNTTDLTPVLDGITVLKTDYLTDILNKTTGSYNRIFDSNVGLEAVYNKTEGLRQSLLELSGSVNSETTGLKSIFDKAQSINTGLFDSVSGLSGKILGLSSSIENPTDGLKAIKTAINSLYGGGTRDLLDIYNKVDAISTTKYTLTLLEPEIIALNSTFINLLDVSMPAITTNKILKFSTIMDGGLFKYNDGLMESGATSAVEIAYTITANFTPLENIKLYFVNTSGTDKAIGIISISNTINAPKTWTLNGSIKTSLITGNVYKIVYTGTETSADITAATFTINQI